MERFGNLIMYPDYIVAMLDYFIDIFLTKFFPLSAKDAKIKSDKNRIKAEKRKAEQDIIYYNAAISNINYLIRERVKFGDNYLFIDYRYKNLRDQLLNNPLIFKKIKQHFTKLGYAVEQHVADEIAISW